MLPDVPLFGAGNRAIRLTDYRHRKHLVLLVFTDLPGLAGNSPLLSLSARYQEFAEENAEVLAVFPATAFSRPGPFPAGHCPFPVLEDRDGALSGAFPGHGIRGIPRLSVHVADRYGEIFRTIDVADGALFPMEEILSWLRFLERLCPE